METEKTINEMTDKEIINKVVPAWARALNVVYEHTFGPVNRFLEWLDGRETRQFVAAFEAREARAAAQKGN